MTNMSLKEQLIEVSQDYLGPAADRFINRQISTHLKKSADNITHADVGKLIDWLRLSFALLTKNSELVDEYADRLKMIAEGRPAEALGGEWSQS